MATEELNWADEPLLDAIADARVTYHTISAMLIGERCNVANDMHVHTIERVRVVDGQVSVFVKRARRRAVEVSLDEIQLINT